MNEMLYSYLEDLKDNILVFNEALMELEKNYEDFENINSIFRVAHTIKGNSGAMEFKNIEKPMHYMEDYLQLARDGEEKINEKTITVLYACHDFLEDCLEKLSDDGSDTNVDTGDLMKKLDSLKNGEEESETEESVVIEEGSFIESIDSELLEVVKSNLSRGHFVYTIKLEINPDSPMKWMRAFLAFQKMEDYTVCLHSNPDRPTEDDMKAGDTSFEGNVLEVLVYCEEDNIEMLIDELEAMIDIVSVEYAAFNPNSTAAPKAEKTPVEKAEVVEEKEDEEPVEEPETVDKSETEEMSDREKSKLERRKKRKEEKAAEEAQNGKKQVQREELMRIPVKKVDNLIDMLGELLILNSQLELQFEAEGAQNGEIGNTLPRMVKIVKQIQTLSMSLRMVECKATLHRLTRIARDTAATLGKEIKIVLEGEETEIDRSVSEKIFDPLMHMVRNAVSHGIEDRDERIASGKDGHGTVTISAYNKRGSVYIDVIDDGGGINTDKVLKKAIKQGIADKDTVYTEEEILRFIFAPGFSTQEEINNISGRGVGMNVVESEVKKMRGKVDVRTMLGKGSTFQIKIPMNLALLNGTVVQIGDEQYIIPTLYIKEFYISNKDDIIMMQGNENAIRIRDAIMPILKPYKLFGEGEENTGSGSYVILEMDQKFVALPVDRIIGKQEIVSKNLSEEFDAVKYAAGASILGDGHVAVILDIEAVFNAVDVKA